MKIGSFMNKKTHLISGFLILITVFLVAYKNSNVKGFRRFLVALKLAVILTFNLLSPADAKDNGFLPVADGFTPPLSRPVPNNHGYFGSKTTSSSGAPKKDLPQNPAMKKDSQPTPTSYQHLSQTSKKKNKQCSLEDEQKSRQAEKE